MNGNDTNKIKNAVRSLGTIEPEYSVQLLEVFSLNSEQKELKAVKVASASAKKNIIADMDISITCNIKKHKGPGESAKIKNH